MKSKPSRSFIPMAFSCSTVEAKLVRWMSGTLVGSISSLEAVFSVRVTLRRQLKHLDLKVHFNSRACSAHYFKI